MQEFSLEVETYREYDFGGRVYRIDNPIKLFLKEGSKAHRVLDDKGVIHYVPAPGHFGCILRWLAKDSENPINF